MYMFQNILHKTPIPLGTGEKYFSFSVVITSHCMVTEQPITEEIHLQEEEL